MAKKENFPFPIEDVICSALTICFAMDYLKNMSDDEKALQEACDTFLKKQHILKEDGTLDYCYSEEIRTTIQEWM